MYRVVVVTDGTEYVLHDVHSNEQIYNDEWTEKAGKTSTFRFSISPDHIHYNKIHPLSSEIRIYRDRETEFFGRSVTPQKDMYNTFTVECVGGMSYLADSVQRPFSHTGTIAGFLEYVLSVHNGMVEERKRFQVGIVNVVGVECTRTIEGYVDTLTVLNEYLVAESGGYLRVREDSGVRYLDYLIDYGGYNTQPIRFGENLLDLSRQIDAADIITCLIPEGDEVEIANEDGTISNAAINITSVNGGKDYILNQDAVDKWGMIWGIVQFNGVTDPSDLLKLAEKYLAEKVVLPEKFELTAFDLSLVDVSIESLKIGHWTNLVSKPHGITATYMLQEITRHITAPQNDKVSFGGERETISGTSAGMSHNMTVQINKVKQSTSLEINRKVENATQLITGGLGGYIMIGRADDGHPEEILIMDAPTKEDAKNLIRLNKNGIGFSNAGYAGPYRNAWTIDGNLIADFITTGTMHADRIRGGTLEVGGTSTGKDGVILIKDASGKVIGRLDKSGIAISNGTFSGTVKGSKISGGSIEIEDFFSVDEDGIVLGDFMVSVDDTYCLQSKDGVIKIFTSGSPSGDNVHGLQIGKAMIYGGGFYGTTAEVDFVDADSDSKNYSYFYDIMMGKSWWDDWSITETVQDLWEQVDDLSDERAKENVGDIDADEAVSFLTSARPVVFQYKRDGKWSAGFIAQEVDSAMDELGIYFPIVGTDKRTGLYKVDYRTYIPLLVKAYQALYAEVQELKSAVSNTSEEVRGE